MRSGSTDRMTNNSKELRDNSVESTQQQEIKKSSKQTKVVQRKRSSSDRNKVVQNIQNNINLQFAGATQILDPFNSQVKLLEQEYLIKLSVAQDSQKITEVQQYFITEALSLTQKVSPSLSDFLQNLTTNLKDQYEKQLNFVKQDIQQYQKVTEELQEQIQLEQSKIATFNLEVSQLKKKTKIQDSTIQKKDQTIYQLEQQIDDLSKQNRQFLGKYDEGKILEEIKILVGENQELKSAVREVKSELDYGKQRENKLMYFLFVLQRKGIPIYDIFDLNIKDLATTRFSPDLDDQYKNIYFEQLKRILFKKLDGDDMPFVLRVDRLNQSVNLKRIKYFENDNKLGNGQGLEGSQVNQSNNLSESYYPICDGPVILPKKPKIIPSLDLKQLTQSVVLNKQRFIKICNLRKIYLQIKFKIFIIQNVISKERFNPWQSKEIPCQFLRFPCL